MTRDYGREIAHDVASARQRARFTGYGRCPVCGALPDNPCREMYGAGFRVPLTSPHHSRPKRGDADA